VPGLEPKRVELGRGEITIGRDKECNIHLPLPNASRKHARLFAKGEEFLIEDLNSTNGTVVNGVRISRCVLRNNDQIRIGEARMQFIHQKFRV
jgi:pSer/pThr/pTyr-binding forkhead associated (FHA) protein